MTTPMIPARPTTYRGIPMRSRLEASFAALLDAAPGVRWEYEPRAFANEHGQYLPDFRMEQYDPPFDCPIYIEVRPTVERALVVLERMEIILSSEPVAMLIAVVPGIGWWLRFSDAPLWTWRTEP